MSRRFYYVSATKDQGIKDCEARGWVRNAVAKFITPTKDEVIVVWLAGDLLPFADKTPMIKGTNYESGPDNEFELKRWAGDETRRGEKEGFDRFVAEGGGEWTDVPAA